MKSSFSEEQLYAEELETERDQLRHRVNNENLLRETIVSEKDKTINELRDKIKELEESALKRDATLQQLESQLDERDALLKEKLTLLEEKCAAYNETVAISEKRRKQIEQMRQSIKSKDAALTGLNNKYRALLSQVRQYPVDLIFFFFWVTYFV